MKRILILWVFLSAFTVGYAQNRSVTGKVTDSDSERITGVIVKVKGTTVQTATDSDGNFKIVVPAGKSILQFFFVGFESQEVDVGEKNNLRVKLKEASTTLDEVVAVGYGTQKKETLTGAISQLKPTDILKSPVPNMGAALAGRVLGVSTNQFSGQPGEDDVVLRIRGNGTLDGSSAAAAPLVLVDGVERSFYQIDPNEIESFSVLKDAASTAVFGIRGANGVIVITTKKGKIGAPKVSISANNALQQPTRLQTNLDALTFARRFNQGWLNDGHPAPYFSDADISLFQSGADPLGHANNDWKASLVKPVALQQQYNFNVSGGTEKTQYYTSIGYLDQGGQLKNFDGQIEGHDLSTDFFYKRVNFRTNVDVNITPTTKIGMQIGGIIGNKQATNNPTQTFQDIVYAAPMAGWFVYGNKIVSLARYEDLKQSPLNYFLTNVVGRKSNVINTNLNFSQKLDFITTGLLFRGMGAYDSEYNLTLNTANPNAKVFYSVINTDPLVLEQDGEYGILRTPTSSFSRRQSAHAELALEYKHRFNGHNVTGLFLGTLDKKWWHDKDYNTVPISYMGVVGRFTYDYRSRYLFEVNMGYNGSENFPADKRFSLFPAVSAGWNVTEEPFFKASTVAKYLSKLKLRASYGIVGNDGSGSSRFLYLNGSYNPASGIFYMGSTSPKKYAGYTEGILGNPDVTWETATKQNYGFDLGMFNNALTMTTELFYEDRVDILANISTQPAHLAIASQDVYNIGHVKNRGYEIEFNWKKNIKDFGYWIGAGYSFVRNKVIEDGSIADPNNPQLWTRGRSTGLSWIYVADGFFDNQLEIIQGPTAGKPTLGDVKIVDVNGDGIIDGKDVIPTKYPELPEITYNFNLGFSYKNFSLSCLLQGAANSTKILTGYYKTFNLPYPDQENWAVGNEANAVRPRLSIANTYSYSTANSTIWTQDGSYLKLRNVEISYTFDRKFVQRNLHIDNLRVYANGQNLYSWDKLKYVDPEMKTNAATFGSYGYPQLRVFNFGLNLSF